MQRRTHFLSYALAGTSQLWINPAQSPFVQGGIFNDLINK
jgi:hypothetical protein